MSELRQAAEMALEALGSDSISFKLEARVALRQALAQPEQEPVGYVTDSGKSAYILLGVDLEDDTPLYTAPPSIEAAVLAEREACAKLCEQLGMATNGIDERNHECAAAIRARGIDGATVGEVGVWGNKREWVGLTADEIWKCNKAETGSAVEFHICSAHQNLLDFAEAIETKLKEKNT